MIDLCIDARMAEHSGIGTCIRHIAPLLTSSFRVLLLVNKKGAAWCDGMEQIEASSSIYSLTEQWQLPLKIPKVDLFWSPHYNIPLLPIRAKKRLVTIHDACHLALSHYLSFPERLYAKVVMQAASRLSDRVLTDSLFSKQELSRFLKTDDIYVVPMAVNKTHFQPAQNTVPIQQKYNLPSRFFLFVGNLKPHKNLLGLINAFEQGAFPEHHLVLVGKLHSLRHSIGPIEGKRILVLDNVPDADLPALYTLADLFILPSFYEGFGLPPLEAMCCHCPTIVSQAASLPEVCGNASLYFDPHNTQDMIRAMKQGLDSRKILIEKGQKRVESFDWAKTTEEYKRHLLEIL
jgi:glycosyltransferase involved in cell wall biosynthesis